MRISRANLPKISRFHHIPGSCTPWGILFRNILISLGFAYDFSFCQNYGWFRIIQPKNTQKTINHTKFLRRILQIIYKKYGGLIGPKNGEILEFQKVEISKIQIFQGCSRIFLVFFEVNSWEIRGDRVHYGSKKSKILKVPRIIQKVLGYDRGP